jgi:hypothetical protein
MILSIIISNRNDVTMLSVTIRSCIEALRPIGLDNCEIVIVDNSDPVPYSHMPSVIPQRYVREGLIKFHYQPFPCLFTAREKASELATGTYILCIDSHMLIGHNMFVDLLQFMQSHSNDPSIAFAHAPINWAHQHEAASKHDRDMSVNELGNWNVQYSTARTITWKGMPWICRREWFLDIDKGLNGYGALAQHKISWGGGDMHIGIKPWLLGFKNYAVPTTPGIHIGPFPKIDTNPKDKNSSIIGPDKYRLYSKSGSTAQCLGFLISCYVLGGEPMMRRNAEAITQRFGRYLDVNKEWDKAIKLGSDERKWLEERQTITFNQLLKTKPWDNI